MTIHDFVSYVLCVPTNLIGHRYIVSAIVYVVSSDGALNFYEYLKSRYSRNYAAIEKCLRSAKNKALDNMQQKDFIEIFPYQQKDKIKTKEFICCAANYYLKCKGEFNENKKA